MSPQLTFGANTVTVMCYKWLQRPHHQHTTQLVAKLQGAAPWSLQHHHKSNDTKSFNDAVFATTLSARHGIVTTLIADTVSSQHSLGQTFFCRVFLCICIPTAIGIIIPQIMHCDIGSLRVQPEAAIDHAHLRCHVAQLVVVLST